MYKLILALGLAWFLTCTQAATATDKPRSFVVWKDGVQYEWKEGRKGDQSILYRSGKQLGVVWYADGKFYTKESDLEKAGKCPVDLPPWMPFFGVDLRRLQRPVDPARFLHNGKPVTRADALALVGAELPADKDKLRLTIIGPAADTARVAQDLDKQPLAALKDRFVVQSYEPSHWAVAGAGFKCDGPYPVVYLQAPDGKVLHRQDGYEGPDKLAEAVRKADPNYDPKRDPDLSLPFQLPGFLQSVPVLAWVLGGLGILFLLKGKSRE